MAATSVDPEETEHRLQAIPPHIRQDVSIHDDRVLPKYLTSSSAEGIRNFVARDTDTFVITWPKAGTTWTMYLVNQIMRGQEFVDTHMVFTTFAFMEFPMDPTDFSAGGRYQTAIDQPPPRYIMTHVPFDMLPKNLLQSGAKIVYVARNPKDAAVSFYNFITMHKILPNYTDWNEFFDQFCRGLVPFDDWFDHVLTGWKLRDRENILFIKYEDMKKDLKSIVHVLCEFLGKSLTDEEVAEICRKSTFEKMKRNDKVNPDGISAWKSEDGGKKTKSFMRKGVVGDWKNWFTVAQSERFDGIFRSKMEGTGLEFVFDL